MLYEPELMHKLKTETDNFTGYELLIIDSLDVMMSKPSAAQTIFVFIKELKKQIDYGR